MRNALQYDFNGGAGANAPTHRLVVVLIPSETSVTIDITSGRPTAEVDGIKAVLSARRNCDRQDRRQGFDDGARRRRRSRFGAAFCPAARAPRRRRPRHPDGRRGHPQPAGVVFRRRHLKPVGYHHGRRQSCGCRRLCRAPRSGAAGGAGVRTGRRPRQRARQCHHQGVSRRSQRSVRAGAAGRRRCQPPIRHVWSRRR